MSISRDPRPAQSIEGLLEAYPDAIVVVGSTGVARLVNRAAERLFGRPREEMLGERVAFPIDGPGPTNMEIVAGGARRDIEVRLVPLEWDGESASLASIRDVTDQRAARHRLRRAQELEAVGRLAGGIAHDFDNLLSGITTFASLVRDTLDHGDPRREDLTQVLTAGGRAVELTQELFALSPKEQGPTQPIDLSELLVALEGVCQRLAGDRIGIDTHCAAGLWPVLVEPGHFERIVTTLVVDTRNAIEARGSIAIEIRNDHDPSLGECVLCRISGTGEGPTEEETQGRLELLEEKSDPSSGLATVYDWLTQARGALEVSSARGRRTRFELRFRRADDAPPSTWIPSRAPPSPGRAVRTILLAEDEPIVRKSVSRMLRRGGYRLLEARTGAEALTLFSAHDGEVDLALLDVVMPDLSGPETAIRLRAESPSVKILFMSGYPRDLFEANAEAKSLGPMIQKPMTEGTLLAAVEKALDST